MERGYIEQLHAVYETEYGNRRQGAAVLAIDTDDLDYVRNPEDLKSVENRLRQALRLVPFQPELPLETEGEGRGGQ
jgi:deoxyadenosine/deoxycytidine kinase